MRLVRKAGIRGSFYVLGCLCRWEPGTWSSEQAIFPSHQLLPISRHSNGARLLLKCVKNELPGSTGRDLMSACLVQTDSRVPPPRLPARPTLSGSSPRCHTVGKVGGGSRGSSGGPSRHKRDQLCLSAHPEDHLPQCPQRTADTQVPGPHTTLRRRDPVGVASQNLYCEQASLVFLMQI